MALSIGVDYVGPEWHVCIREHQQNVKLNSYAQPEEFVSSIERICALYPEPTIVLSLHNATAFQPLYTLDDARLAALSSSQPGQDSHIMAALLTLRALNLHSYCSPSLKYLPTIPAHRKRMPPNLGTASQFCTLVTLLHHMRQQEADWSEMNFLYFHADSHRPYLLVVEHGVPINGAASLARIPAPGEAFQKEQARASSLSASTFEAPVAYAESETLRAQAYWESVTQELAGFLALHHCTDIVLLGSEEDECIERFGDLYQLYHFPHMGSAEAGYESAIGAALLAEGLYGNGVAAEVVARLQLRQTLENPPQEQKPAGELPS